MVSLNFILSLSQAGLLFSRVLFLAELKIVFYLHNEAYALGALE